MLGKAIANIKVSLELLRKRQYGYHEVKMNMTTIYLADSIDLTELAEYSIENLSHNRYVQE
ncbi:4-(cytidine 5'-diphospho)-2-C-methyl-D-erythritol kinase, partial [Bacillus cereus]|nr:4-(cytidine 5'-diphospho)-2-C-methyl-D-erythritol kinase [Bacillus cereus]